MCSNNAIKTTALLSFLALSVSSGRLPAVDFVDLTDNTIVDGKGIFRLCATLTDHPVATRDFVKFLSAHATPVQAVDRNENDRLVNDFGYGHLGEIIA